jgi:hypothetical protein
MQRQVQKRERTPDALRTCCPTRFETDGGFYHTCVLRGYDQILDHVVKAVIKAREQAETARLQTHWPDLRSQIRM